jgi:DNA polymerase
MKTDWDEMVEGILGHLDELKEQGVRFLPVAPQTLAALDTLSAKARLIQRSPRTRVETSPASGAMSAKTSEKDAGRAALPRSRPCVDVVAAPHGDADSSDTTGVSQEARLPSAGEGERLRREEEGLHQHGSESGAASRQAKAAAMAELRERALACRKCLHLAQLRKNVVFGVGDIHSPLMFVGEAPGADEDAQGEPFVGAAGQLLTRIIKAMGFSRDTVYIANILKCRPDTPGQASGNRKPTPEEMKTCSPYLLEQIDLIQPKVIVALGATAVEGLLGRTEGISKLRGHFQQFRGVPVMPTFHPSYLLRSESLAVKRQVWEDMLKVLERLHVPITEKQRNYFLKGSG